MKRTHVFCWTLLLLGLAARTAPAAEERIDPAQWAPEEALFFVGATDVKEVWDDFKKTGGYKLLSDPELAKNASDIGMVANLAEQLQTHFAEIVGVAPDQLKNPLAGPAALYAQVPPGGDPNNLFPVLVASVGDPETMRQYFTAAVDKLKAQSDGHEEIGAGPATIHVFTRQRKAKEPAEAEEESFGEFEQPESPDQMVREAMRELFDPDNLPPRLAACLTDERLVIGGSAEEVRAALREDRGRTLADSEDYKSLLRHLKPTGNVRMLFNIPRGLELARQTATGEEAEEFRRWTSVIGTQSLRSAVGHLRMGASSYESKLELLFLMSGQRSGLAEILSMENRPTTPPPFVAADACVYLGLNANISRIIDQVEQMVRQADPQAADEMRAALEKVPVGAGEPVNLRQELLQYLTAPITVGLTAMRPFTPDNINVQATLAHRDQSAVNRFLARFEGQMLTGRDVRGTQVYDVMFPPGLVLAALSDRLVFTATSALDASLAGSAEPLAQTPAWQRATRFVPDEAWMTVWMDNRKMIEAALELRKDPAAGMAMMSPGPMLLSMFAQQAQQDVTGDPEPVMRKMMEHATTDVVTVATTPEGVQLTMISMKPE